MKEEWREIEYAKGYFVSSDGRIKKDNKILKQYSHPKGYFQITIDGNNYLVHRLVVDAFPEICGVRFKNCEIDHINTVRDDNRAVNLRVVSKSQNHLNPITRKRMSEAQINSPNKNRKPILQYTKEGEFIREWSCAWEIQRELGYKNSNITDCCKNKPHYISRYGYLWKFKEEEI